MAKRRFKKLSKKILKSPIVISIAAWLIAQFIRFVYYTTKWERRNFAALDPFEGKPFIFTFWHGRLMMTGPPAPKWMKAHVLSSGHSDGILIAKTVGHFGIKTIWGSSSKDGDLAIRGIMKAMENNQTVAITPDGPRGPARKVGGKVVEIAKKLDIPIIPVTFSTNKRKIAKSWDNFMVAKPFGKGVIIVGNPVKPQTNAELEKIMNDQTDEADLVAKSL